jgi:hypothetical protein
MTYGPDVPKIDARIGEVFEVEIESNPASTGIDWYLSALDGVILVGSRFVPGLGIGFPGKKYFSLRAWKEVEGLIQLMQVGPGVHGNVYSDNPHAWAVFVKK